MPLAKIKTEEERARLDAIFAELEAAERCETTNTTAFGAGCGARRRNWRMNKNNKKNNN